MAHALECKPEDLITPADPRPPSIPACASLPPPSFPRLPRPGGNRALDFSLPARRPPKPFAVSTPLRKLTGLPGQSKRYGFFIEKLTLRIGVVKLVWRASLFCLIWGRRCSEVGAVL